MTNKSDLSIFEKFGFAYKPVAVKFLLTKPEGLTHLAKKLAFCEMLKEAQDSEPFYVSEENHECKAGAMLLGMADPDLAFESGQIGPRLGVYEDARANRRLYLTVPRMERGIVNFLAYSSLDKLSFDPDLLIITAKPSQTEILLRAMAYRTGVPWAAKGTTVLGCAWLYMYPYVHGKLNLMITGLHHGMKARNIFPEGLLLISIPFDIIPDIVENLAVMKWDLPQYSWGKEMHLVKMKEIADEIHRELKT